MFPPEVETDAGYLCLDCQSVRGIPPHRFNKCIATKSARQQVDDPTHVNSATQQGDKLFWD